VKISRREIWGFVCGALVVLLIEGVLAFYFYQKGAAIQEAEGKDRKLFLKELLTEHERKHGVTCRDSKKLTLDVLRSDVDPLLSAFSVNGDWRPHLRSDTAERLKSILELSRRCNDVREVVLEESAAFETLADDVSSRLASIESIIRHGFDSNKCDSACTSWLMASMKGAREHVVGKLR
jgi:hypothetical protein